MCIGALTIIADFMGAIGSGTGLLIQAPCPPDLEPFRSNQIAQGILPVTVKLKIQYFVYYEINYDWWSALGGWTESVAESIAFYHVLPHLGSWLSCIGKLGWSCQSVLRQMHLLVCIHCIVKSANP